MDAQELAIKDYLIAQIDNGTYATTEPLPSDYQLVEQFGVPRMKVRNVYALLEQLGYIYARKGIGRFICAKKQLLDMVLSGDVSFSEKMKAQAKQYYSVVMRAEVVRHEHAIFQKSYVTAQNLYLVERLRFVDEVPAALHRSYILLEHVPEVQERERVLSSIHSFYRELGIEQFHSTFSKLDILVPDEEIRHLLQSQLLVPIMKLESDNWDSATNRQLEYTEIFYRTDRFQFQF